jgi:hypothetical protein
VILGTPKDNVENPRTLTLKDLVGVMDNDADLKVSLMGWRWKT